MPEELKPGPGVESMELEKKLLTRFQEDAKEANDGLSSWHREAEEEERFGANHQWDKTNTERLDAEMRPHLTFNQVHRVIQAMSGKEMMSRYGIRYKPRDFSDERGAGLVTEQVRFHRQQSFAKFEESQAFKDLCTTGVGCTEIYTDFQDDPTGIIHNVRIPRREVYWDPLARRRNLLDARYVIRGRWMDEDDFEAMFKVNPKRLNQADLFNQRSNSDIHDASTAWMYLSQNGRAYRQSRREVLVADYQYREFQDAIVFTRPDGLLDYVWEDKAQQVFAEFQQMGYPVGPTFKQTRPRYYRCYIAGEKVLKREQLPGRGFTYNFMTGFEDPDAQTQSGRVWFGLMRIMREPQEWFNKVMSQVVHMLSTNPKGAMIAAPGVFENKSEAKREWSQPGGYMEANRVDFKDKIEIVRAEGIPTSLLQILGSVGNMVTSLVGINPEYDLGQATDLKRVSGEALGQVKQASSSVAAPLVDALAQFRGCLGIRYLEQIRKYIPQGQALRVYSGYQEQEEQVTRQEIFGRYDVLVDESPETLNSSQDTYEALFAQGNAQFLLQGGPGGLPLIPYTVLPAVIPNLSPEVRQQMQEHAQLLQNILMSQLQPQQPQAPGQGPPQQGAPPQ